MGTSRARVAVSSGTVIEISTARRERRVVGLATGMLMQRYGVDESTATELLGGRADEAGLSIGEYAQQMTEDVALDAL